MPPSAYALIGLFTAISVAAGAIGAWIVGPRRLTAAVLPALAAFGSLYLVGHRWVLVVGPQVELFGWEISLPFEVAVALAVALAAAAVQRAGLRLLQADERRARGDGLT